MAQVEIIIFSRMRQHRWNFANNLKFITYCICFLINDEKFYTLGIFYEERGKGTAVRITPKNCRYTATVSTTRNACITSLFTCGSELVVAIL